MYFPRFTQNRSIWRKLESAERIRQNSPGSPKGLMCLKTKADWLVKSSSHEDAKEDLLKSPFHLSLGENWEAGILIAGKTK